MKARDAMTKSPTCATPDARLEAVARMMVKCDCGAIPIVSDERGYRSVSSPIATSWCERSPAGRTRSSRPHATA